MFRTGLRRRTDVIWAAIAAVLLLAGTAAPASAAPSTASDADVAAAVQRINAKTYTAADLDLVRSHPAVAAHVVDPTRAPKVELKSRNMAKQVTLPAATASRATATASRATALDAGKFAAVSPGPTTGFTPGEGTVSTTAAEQCGWTELWITEFSFSGGPVYTWIEHVGACWDGNNVTRWTEWRDFSYSWDPSWIYLGLVNLYLTAVGPEADVFMQGFYVYCPPFWGCQGGEAPWGVIAVNGNGDWGYAAGIY